MMRLRLDLNVVGNHTDLFVHCRAIASSSCSPRPAHIQPTVDLVQVKDVRRPTNSNITGADIHQCGDAALAAAEAVHHPLRRGRLGVDTAYDPAGEAADFSGALIRTGPHQRLPVRISAPDLCGRFSGRVVRGVNTKAATPQWMVDRLARCGQRSVTALVDISNYVMFEFGRPSHIFDLDKIHGGLDVRWGKPGEQLKLLNGNTVTVDEKVGVIADDVQVESLAGIMGGDATAVSDDTQHVYVEAAFWWPKAIAGRSRRFNFSTDAGHRFERGVDPNQTIEHIERITQLILDICGTEATQCGPMDDWQVNLPRVEPVRLRVARASKVIGMPLTLAQCADALTRLSLPLTLSEGTGLGGDAGVVTVTPPSYRFDLQIEEDLIEEVARMVGYNELPKTPPLAPITAKLRPESQRSPFAVRRSLAAMGYQETINFSFVEERWEHESGGQSESDQVAQPDCQPDERDALSPAGLLAAGAQVQPRSQSAACARVRVGPCVPA